MFDAQDKHRAGLVPNLAEYPVIPNAVAPQPALVMAQRLAEASRVFLRGNAGVHVVEDFPLHGPVNGLQVFLHPWVVLNCPDQGSCVTGWR